MTPQGRSRRLAALTTAALAAACILAPSAGARAQPSDGDLSSRLAELAKPSVRSAPPERQAKILDVAPDGAGSLLRDGNRVLVSVRFDRGAIAGVDDLREAGAKIIDVSGRYQTVTAAVAPGRLREVASVPRVGAVTENLAPILAATCPGGDALSEGDDQLRAAAARATHGVDGSGITVGILSDSFDRDTTAPTLADDDVLSGDLPGTGNPCGQTMPVDESGDTYGGSDASDEGRAMAQIVHDLAPGARIAFATAFNSLTSFANNVRALRDAGAKVIVDDVIWLNEPFFQEGPVGVAVSDVTASAVTYFSSAGNNNLIVGGRDVASWETPQFRGGGGANICPSALTLVRPYVTDCLDFDPSTGLDGDFSITVQTGRTLTVDLQWAQPWFGVSTDLDGYLLDSSGNLIAESEEDNVGGSQEPVEVLSWENTGSSQTVRFAIGRCAGGCNPTADSGVPRIKFALLLNGSGVTATEYSQSVGGDIVGPSIFGHNGAEDAMSVGAIRYNTTLAPESFSSRGPVVHHFGPVVGTTPASPLPSPKVLSKPDLVATDCGVTTFFFGDAPPYRFCGTSAAAPHAAAIAALELEAAPGIGPLAVKQAQIETADPVGTFAPCAVGAGILNAVDAVAEAKVPGSGTSPAPCVLPASPPIPPDPESTLAPAPEPQSTGFSGSAAKKRDRTRPQTRIVKKPAQRSFTRGNAKRLFFRFASSEKGSSFLCKIDRGRFHQCWRKLIRWFKVGKHVLKVKARDRADNVDRTPAVYRFQIKRRG